jgi:hypothetical protein
MKQLHLTALRKAGFTGKATIERMFEFIGRNGSISPWFDLKQNKEIWRCSITDRKYNTFGAESESIIEAVAECCLKYHKDGVKTGIYLLG